MNGKNSSRYFITWLIISLMLLFIFSNNIEFLLFDFGQMFTILGIYAFVSISSNDKPRGLILLLIILGVILLIFGCAVHYNILLLNMDTFILAKKIFISTITIVLIATGISTLLDNSKQKRRAEEACVFETYGVCIEIKESKMIENGKLFPVYYPVYEIKHQGEMVEICDEHYKAFPSIKVGKEYNLRINTHNINQFIDKVEENKYIRQTIFGIFLLVCGLATTPFLYSLWLLQ